MSQADLLGKFIWHELMTPNAQAAADFYSNVLPWTSEASTMPGHTLWMSGGSGVAGSTTQPQSGPESDTPPSWLVYIAAPDVDVLVEAAERLGGKQLKEPTDIPGIGRFAVLSDPQGAAFAVFTPPAQAPARVIPAPVGQFSWHGLATIDPQAALAFYAELFGWTRGAAHDMGIGGVYQIIEHAGVPIGGVYALQDPSKPPHWLSYVRIEGLEDAVSAVRTHGGHVLLEPHVVPGGDRVAHVMDPMGGVIALHETLWVAPAATAARPRARTATRRAAAHRRSASTRAARRRPPARAKRSAIRSAKPSAKRAKHVAKRAKPSAKRPAKRIARGSAKPSAKRPAKRVARGSAKPSAKRPAKRVAKRPMKSTARRGAKPAGRRTPARKTAAVKQSMRKTHRARAKKAVKRTTRRTARRR